MITDIRIKGLFDQFDYDIILPNDYRMVFLTGPNGYGKTTILNIIENLSECRFEYFFEFPFESIVVDFSDNGIITRFEIIKSRKQAGENELSKSFPFHILEIRMWKGTVCLKRFTVDEEKIAILLSSQHRRLLTLVMKGAVDDSELVDVDMPYEEDCKSIKAFFAQNPCLMIKDQRIQVDPVDLLHKKGKLLEFKDADCWTINQVNKELKDVFAKVIAEYSRCCQQVDATFITRLQSPDCPNYTEKEYLGKLESLENLNKRLAKFGLVTEVEVNRSFSLDQSKALSLYIDDRLAKVEPLLKLVEKLEIFSNILERKELTNKEIKITSSRNLTLLCKSGDELPLEKLSSGEQNLIILFFYLVFKLPNNGVLLIDEPEKSLHLAWKRQLLEDFSEATAGRNCQLLIATHSVALIDEQWDSSIDLFDIAKPTQSSRNGAELTRDSLAN